MLTYSFIPSSLTLDVKTAFECILQPKPQFQPSSSKGQQNETTSTASTAEPATKQADQPLSYAEYIVKSKSNVAAVPQRDRSSKVLRTEGAPGLSSLDPAEPQSMPSNTRRCEPDQDFVQETEAQTERVKKSEETLMTDGKCQKSDPCLNQGPKPVGSGSSIIVSPRQVSLNLDIFLIHEIIAMTHIYHLMHLHCVFIDILIILLSL